MRGLSGTGLGRGGLFTFGVITLLAIGTFALAGSEMLKRVDARPAKRAIQPTGAQEASPEAVAQTAAKTEPKSKADQVERAVKEPDPCLIKRPTRRLRQAQNRHRLLRL